MQNRGKRQGCPPKQLEWAHLPYNLGDLIFTLHCFTHTLMIYLALCPYNVTTYTQWTVLCFKKMQTISRQFWCCSVTRATSTSNIMQGGLEFSNYHLNIFDSKLTTVILLLHCLEKSGCSEAFAQQDFPELIFGYYIAHSTKVQFLIEFQLVE